MLNDLEKARFNSLANEIGEWARTNFGHNDAKPEWVHDICPNIRLHFIAPLIGIGEEIGEMTAALFARDMVEVADGFADVLIYSADFCYRLQFDFAQVIQDAFVIVEKNLPASPRFSMQTIYGKLCHHCLKSVQGIRGYENGPNATSAIHAELVYLLWAVFMVALPSQNQAVTPVNVLSSLEHTWTSIVAKRNWKANPANANG